MWINKKAFIALQDRIKKAETRLEELKPAISLRFCSECGKPYEARFDYSDYVSLYARREKEHCKDCDSVVARRKKAEALARKCPDEVIKACGKKKKCKSV